MSDNPEKNQLSATRINEKLLRDFLGEPEKIIPSDTSKPTADQPSIRQSVPIDPSIG